MKALITGASSGIGMEIARELAARGYELILVARRRERLEALARELTVKCRILEFDLSSEEQCRMLYCRARSEDLEIVINNAGFGVCGPFATTDLERDLEMVRLNIVAVHILTKLFLHDFRMRNRGYILNVASSAGFMAGPLMATYYATKNYVANVRFSVPGMDAKRCARIAVRGLLHKKQTIVPGAGMKAAMAARRFVPECILPRVTYRVQHRKLK